MPDDLSPLRRLLGHLLTTDPDRFWVATKGDDGADGADGADGPAIGFSSASVREGLWFLAMLFVDPAVAGGRDRAGADGSRAGGSRRRPGRPGDPGPRRSARLRHPHVGHVHGRRPADLERPLRAARHGAAHPDLAAHRRGPTMVRRAGAARRALARCRSRRSTRASRTARGDSPPSSTSFDRELIGAAHPVDHAFQRREGRVGFLVRETRAAGRSATSTARPSAGWARSPPSTRRSTRR